MFTPTLLLYQVVVDVVSVELQAQARGICEVTGRGDPARYNDHGRQPELEGSGLGHRDFIDGIMAVV